ncbi:MAG: L-aspartate oxidase [Flavobacteriales bacterium]|jgi:L-aspartate oxidase|nr:L-aspartate oxidase [Flavobacteriales bacterium]MBT4705027.1 L-aspartate oxidase [Flavobacteriales bacterium]MBT4929802.1 L-aspartate oxidase [Flavobacteriales bacterium]MBT5133271.1 L-aspartate oxidase [Flavobacteriales bacterium]MBT6131844.1 L-aspartate oxidase [Flavobacteriales bacterium]
MKNDNVDVVVLGGGIAGLYYAHCLSSHHEKLDILILSKDELAVCNTRYAQGGVAVTFDPVFSEIESHVQDTLNAGRGLCDERVVRFVVEEGKEQIQNLMNLGTSFDRNIDGELDMVKEGGHSSNRIVHAKDRTGLEIQNSLMRALKTTNNVRFRSSCLALDLLMDEDACLGVQVLNKDGDNTIISASTTVIATGGIGQLYEVTTNPSVATGDGIAMASRAGAKIQDMAFVQFHPTALYEVGRTPSFLISEAVRGHGAQLRNEDGEAFMFQYDPRGSLATRDIVSKAIFLEMQRSAFPYVWLDVRHFDLVEFAELFPTISEKCQSLGLNLSKEMIPVVPAAHYLCGGIVTDNKGRTSIPNLLCLGEAGRTGMHGANRLASNSLLEALVFAARAARLPYERKPISSVQQESDHRNEGVISATFDIAEIKSIMSNNAGIERTLDGLQFAQMKLSKLKQPQMPSDRNEVEFINMIEVARLVVEDALHNLD